MGSHIRFSGVSS